MGARCLHDCCGSPACAARAAGPACTRCNSTHLRRGVQQAEGADLGEAVVDDHRPRHAADLQGGGRGRAGGAASRCRRHRRRATTQGARPAAVGATGGVQQPREHGLARRTARCRRSSAQLQQTRPLLQLTPPRPSSPPSPALACCRSPLAPVVTSASPKMISSAARPPRAPTMRAKICGAGRAGCAAGGAQEWRGGSVGGWVGDSLRDGWRRGGKQPRRASRAAQPCAGGQLRGRAGAGAGAHLLLGDEGGVLAGDEPGEALGLAARDEGHLLHRVVAGGHAGAHSVAHLRGQGTGGPGQWFVLVGGQGWAPLYTRCTAARYVSWYTVQRAAVQLAGRGARGRGRG